MKLWELVTVCSDAPDETLSRIGGNPNWRRFKSDIDNVEELVRTQDREKLDAELPDDLCVFVLEGLSNRYFIKDGHLHQVGHMSSNATGAPEFSAVDIYQQFGGAVLEEIREFASAAVPKKKIDCATPGLLDLSLR